MDGEDAGRKVQFKNGSVGTMKAMKKLEDAIKVQLRSNRAYPCPVIQLESESYKHSDYGRIQNPIFTIVDWANLQGDLLSEATDGEPEQGVQTQPEPPKPAPAAAAKPPLTKTKPPLQAVAEPQEETAEVTPIRGPRRRPPAA